MKRAEALVDGLWGEQWSPGREKNLHALVYQLRRRLEQAEPGRGGARLARAGGGYRLALGPGELDVAAFTTLAGRGREAARAGDTAAARDLFGQALGCWRGPGPALADAAPLCPVLAGEAARLEEARTAVVEERVTCDLALGRHGEVVAELAGLVAQFPWRERLAGLLMTALYRCGRRGEALAIYDTARRVLAEELGCRPRCWPTTRPWPRPRHPRLRASRGRRGLPRRWGWCRGSCRPGRGFSPAGRRS